MGEDAPMKGRLLSLDALRGFDMLMIMGFGPLVVNLCIACGWGVDCAFAKQFEHVEWNGLRFEDTIFPLFLFLAGVSWPFSCASQRARGVKTRPIVIRCIKRAAILFLFGLIYGGLLAGNLRMGSVLGRIGVAWMVGALLYLFFRVRTLTILAVTIPIAYWLLLYFFPAPDALTLTIPERLEYVKDFGNGPFSIVGNLSGWVDRHWMPGVVCPYTGVCDNQSALGYIPAVGTALLGILSGEFIRNSMKTMSAGKRVGFLILAAASLVGLGLVIANCFGAMSMPINKKLWSASFTFVVGGYSVAMLALFHWIVDVCGFVRWAYFFRVIGMNSIAIYMAQWLIPFEKISKTVFGGVGGLFGPEGSAVVVSAGYVVICWLFLWFLYRKNVFLKV